MLYSRAIETPQKLELSIGDLDSYVSVCDQVDVLACIGACGDETHELSGRAAGWRSGCMCITTGCPPCSLVMGSCQHRLLYGCFKTCMLA